jgi:hypothetical protein
LKSMNRYELGMILSCFIYIEGQVKRESENLCLGMRMGRLEKKQRFTTHLERKQIEDLKALSRVTRITVAVFVREAIDMLLARYERELKRAKRVG